MIIHRYDGTGNHRLECEECGVRGENATYQGIGGMHCEHGQYQATTQFHGESVWRVETPRREVKTVSEDTLFSEEMDTLDSTDLG